MVAALDEVIFLIDTVQRVSIDLEIQPLDANVDVRFDMIALSALPQVDAAPKGVSLLPVALRTRSARMIVYVIGADLVTLH